MRDGSAMARINSGRPTQKEVDGYEMSLDNFDGGSDGDLFAGTAGTDRDDAEFHASGQRRSAGRTGDGRSQGKAGACGCGFGGADETYRHKEREAGRCGGCSHYDGGKAAGWNGV